MTLSSPQGDPWADFLREHGLERQPEHARARPSPSLTRLRREVVRVGRGRPRKVPPVPVLEDQKFCWGCQAALPFAAFATDNKNYDGKRGNCRQCDDAARSARDQQRRARLKAQVSA